MTLKAKRVLPRQLNDLKTELADTIYQELRL